jgi:hypothetical protein
LRPSTPTILGLLVAIATFVVAIVFRAPIVIQVVLIVTTVGWAVFALRDLVRSRRAA